ncbi:MAG: hypothetical protein CVV44_15240 [Spirochaetae bacterium HGW-Spirochaetae-1]|jgi:competence protein ComEC|nr:MAG: hypothetical protein CVV44_15240 [Spirochaetae bacterium HGW-Spirochaetae-1]
MSKKIFVPSLFLLTILAAAILLSHGFYLQQKNLLLTGAAFSVASAAFLAITAIYTLPRGHFLYLLFIAAILLSGAFLRIRNTCLDRELVVLKTPYNAIIVNVSEYRYHSEILLRIQTSAGKKLKPEIMALGYSDSTVSFDISNKLIIREPLKKINPASPSFHELNLLRKGIKYTVRLTENNYETESRERLPLKKKMRAYIVRMLESCYSREQSDLLKSLWFGNKRFIRKSVLHQYKQAGVIHVLAASGLHVGIVAALPLMLLGLLRIKKNAGYFTATVLVAGYLYLTDTPVSLMRACIMFALFALQHGFSRDKNAFNLLFIAAIVILSALPHELYSPGFQLSFGATAGILIFFQRYRPVFMSRPSVLSNSLALTISAQILTIPLILIHFGEINFMGIVSNCVVIPLVSLILTASIPLCLLFPVWPSAAVAAGSIMEWPFRFLQWSVSLLAGRASHFSVGGNLVFPALAVPCLFLIPLFFTGKKKRIAAAASCVLYVFLWIFFIGKAGTAQGEITMVRHGRGICLFMREKEKGCIIGDIPDSATAESLKQCINESSVIDLSLYINRPDFLNMKYYAGITRQLPVSTCTLDSSFRLSRQMNYFLRLIEKDDIIFKIANLQANERCIIEDYKKTISSPINIDSEKMIIYIYSTYKKRQREDAEIMAVFPIPLKIIKIKNEKPRQPAGGQLNKGNDNTAKNIPGQKEHGEHIEPD